MQPGVADTSHVHYCLIPSELIREWTMPRYGLHYHPFQTNPETCITAGPPFSCAAETSCCCRALFTGPRGASACMANCKSMVRIAPLFMVTLSVYPAVPKKLAGIHTCPCVISGAPLWRRADTLPLPVRSQRFCCNIQSKTLTAAR